MSINIQWLSAEENATVERLNLRAHLDQISGDAFASGRDEEEIRDRIRAEIHRATKIEALRLVLPTDFGDAVLTASLPEKIHVEWEGSALDLELSVMEAEAIGKAQAVMDRHRIPLTPAQLADLFRFVRNQGRDTKDLAALLRSTGERSEEDDRILMTAHHARLKIDLAAADAYQAKEAAKQKEMEKPSSRLIRIARRIMRKSIINGLLIGTFIASATHGFLGGGVAFALTAFGILTAYLVISALALLGDAIEARMKEKQGK